MKKFLAILTGVVMALSLAACACSNNASQKPEEETKKSTEEITTEEADESTTEEEETESLEMPDGDPAEYSREFWEEKFPGENICPFTIDENGTERSYYWVSGFEGWEGTMESWLKQPFNWNGWHKTEDGAIVNEDETLKITDDWAKGEESMSSNCTVTTEKYEKGETQSETEGTTEENAEPKAESNETN